MRHCVGRSDQFVLAPQEKVNLIFDNALLYNEPDTVFSKEAKRLKDRYVRSDARDNIRVDYILFSPIV
jgi:hypothetical protein